MKSLLLMAAVSLFANDAAASCTETRVTVFGAFGHAGFTVDVADDAQERAKGLMNVASMPLMSGMLFVYETPHHATFWMRNTLIPLDMIFAGPDGAILAIHENAVPMDETVIDGGQGVKFVLEVNGGLSARLGIKTGDILQHPLIGADAISPCE